MNVRKKVAVLLAAYNGVKWIEEQIQSILNQKNIDVTIFISVDKSTDGTEDVVKRICQQHNNIKYLPFGFTFGGAAKNFYRLMKDVDFESFDFVSLSDQDDIWYPEKLITAVNNISIGYDFYSSNVVAFWENGKRIIIDKAQRQRTYDYFFEAAGPGCTYVFKSYCAIELKNFIVSNYENISEIMLHDWLIYAFARNNGYEWYIDKNPSMDYRQHRQNQVGANVTLSAIIKRIRLVKQKWYRNEIIKLAKVLQIPDNHLVSKCLQEKYLSNLYMIINIHKFRRRSRDRMMLFLLCLINWF
ncbi:glycosyltransferase [Escherichia albertii]|uniref:Predicted glycosyltransferase n=1 Tax=Escherichia albertii TaxID=208962 RepID=A0A5A4U7L0_ESCAL|nr:glycosyltransferase [Escherichia albertii]MCZ7516689.1 glycosyltransferase [Escherichia albertii]BBM62600.1 predicted glycosyltransferase [Escherichia albertii]